jgi:hypothetical protein
MVRETAGNGLGGDGQPKSFRRYAVPGPQGGVITAALLLFGKPLPPQGLGLIRMQTDWWGCFDCLVDRKQKERADLSRWELPA